MRVSHGAQLTGGRAGCGHNRFRQLLLDRCAFLVGIGWIGKHCGTLCRPEPASYSTDVGGFVCEEDDTLAAMLRSRTNTFIGHMACRKSRLNAFVNREQVSNILRR